MKNFKHETSVYCLWFFSLKSILAQLSAINWICVDRLEYDFVQLSLSIPGNSQYFLSQESELYLCRKFCEFLKPSYDLLCVRLFLFSVHLPKLLKIMSKNFARNILLSFEDDKCIPIRRNLDITMIPPNDYVHQLKWPSRIDGACNFDLTVCISDRAIER